MATFGELKTAISGRLLDADNTAVSSSSVAASINEAIRYWKYKPFWFNRAYASKTMTIQDGTMPLPDDFLVPDGNDGAFQIDYSNQRYLLKNINSEEYNAIYRGNGYGRPSCYANIGGSYEAYPLPDRAYTLNSSYLKDYATLTSDTANNDFTNNADRLITLWSLANLYGELRQDSKMESYYRNAALDEKKALDAMTNTTNGTGSLSTW